MGSDQVNPVQVQKYLGGIDYPATKQDLLETARDQGADDRVMNLLGRLPDKKYQKPTDVTKEIGKIE